jgi:hypothetical protein
MPWRIDGWECSECRALYETEEKAEACEASHVWFSCGRRRCPMAHKTEEEATACQFIPAPMTYKQYIMSLYPMSTQSFVTYERIEVL